MAVEHLPAALVRDLSDRIAAARRQASEQFPETRQRADDPIYWQDVFEANAAALLGVLERVRLRDGHVVRYRYYGRRRNDFLIRPFVARADTDVSAVMHVLDWHAPPDSARPSESVAGRDVDLLYKHFTVEPSAAGAFEYWVAVQELWASQRWIHSTVIADSEQFAQITSGAKATYDSDVKRNEAANRKYMPVTLTLTLSETADGNAFLGALGELLVGARDDIAKAVGGLVDSDARAAAAKEEADAAEKLLAVEENARIAVKEAEAALAAGKPEQKEVLEAKLAKARRALALATRAREAAGLQPPK